MYQRTPHDTSPTYKFEIVERNTHVCTLYMYIIHVHVHCTWSEGVLYRCKNVTVMRVAYRYAGSASFSHFIIGFFVRVFLYHCRPPTFVHTQNSILVCTNSRVLKNIHVHVHVHYRSNMMILSINDMLVY